MVDPRQPDALRNMLPIATRVTIIDFDRLPDGMLGITVQGMERVQIEDLWQEPDGLRIGEVTPLTVRRPAGSIPISCRWSMRCGRCLQTIPTMPPSIPPPLGRWQLGGPALAGGVADPPEQKQLLLAAADNQPAIALLKGVLVASH